MDHRDYAKSHGIESKKGDVQFEMAYLVTEARALKGLTCDQLAEKMGTQPALIKSWESGNLTPTLSDLKWMGESVGLTLVFPKWDKNNQ